MVEELDIEHLDEKHNGKIFTYTADAFLWIHLESNSMPTSQITSFSELHPNIFISAKASCGNTVSG